MHVFGGLKKNSLKNVDTWSSLGSVRGRVRDVRAIQLQDKEKNEQTDIHVHVRFTWTADIQLQVVDNGRCMM